MPTNELFFAKGELSLLSFRSRASTYDHLPTWWSSETSHRHIAPKFRIQHNQAYTCGHMRTRLSFGGRASYIANQYPPLMS